MNIQKFGGFYPFNPLLGQEIQTNTNNKKVDASYIAHLSYSADEAATADADAVHAAITASADVVVTTTEDFVAPPCPRNITATAGGTTGSIKAVQVKVYGTNFNDEAINETLPIFTADTAGSVEGAKAFKTVTKVEIPAMDGAGVTVTIGFGDKLGIPYKLSHNTVLVAYLNNVLEATAAGVTVSATALENNTIDLSTALNGSVVDAYLLV